MTDKKQPETDAKSPVTVPNNSENLVKDKPDDQKELTNEELAATAGGIQKVFLKF